MNSFWKVSFWLFFLLSFSVWIFAILSQRGELTFLSDATQQNLRQYESLVLQYFPLLLTLLALFISYMSLQISNERKEIARRQLEESRLEKAQRRLTITLMEAFKQENMYVYGSNVPLNWWVLKFILTNNGSEQEIFSELLIEMEMKIAKERTFTELVFRDTFIEPFINLGALRKYSRYRMYLHDPRQISNSAVGISTSGVRIFSSAKLVNWSSKEQVLFAPNKEIYGPNPGEKQIWLLFGKTTIEFQRFLAEEMNSLRRIICTFTTDSGKLQIEAKYSRSGTISPDFQAELERLMTTD
ncbi:hypothetical protein [Candidatus Leptofilum sp.]|uniref:hypothetical protein n=1 Tax=Candidatus Leptofilum sp. TaxID=3241576 RepID=UPI003B5CA3DA